MANTKLSALTELTSIADGDLVYIVDISDTTDSAQGSSKKITKSNLFAGLTLSDITDITASVADLNATTNFEETISATTSKVTITDGAIDFDIASHDGTNGLKLGGTLVTSSAAELNALDGITATVTELNYTDGVTSAIQTQIDTKAPTASPTFTGTVTLPTGLTGVLRADSGVVSTDSDVTDLVTAASTTAQGKIEIATAAETTTGTDATRAVSPDGLAGSDYGKRIIGILVFDDATDVSTGDGAGDVFVRIPSVMNGWNLVAVAAQVQTAGTTGTTDIQIYNVTQTADMLSTVITIDSGETDSSTAATPAVIDTANDDVATADQIRIDVDAVSTTAPKGLYVELQFQLP